VVLPLKAVVMNLLSISASFGAIVWIFQDGHFAAQLGFTPGSIDPTLPVIMFCTVFGLSMDYEVLLLSRMQEEYLRTRDNTSAVAMGLEKSGRLNHGRGRHHGRGLRGVRPRRHRAHQGDRARDGARRCHRRDPGPGLVVPATMRLLGDLNWWAPGPLARLQRRIGLSESTA